MKGENKYPIKYAILQLKEKGGWLEEYEDIVRGNIVSKCFVVESSIKYFSDGSSRIFHKVVFPFKNLETLKLSLLNKDEFIGTKVIPSYDASYNPYPVDIVLDLFDTYEDAKVKAQEENEKMRHKIVLNVPFKISDPRFKQTLTEYEQAFINQLSVCQLFEKLSLLNTEDMNIIHEMKPNNGFQLLKEKKL